jgi:flagellar biosynthesis protein
MNERANPIQAFEQNARPSSEPVSVQAYERPRTTAVALHYSGRGAPRVTAKGDGHVARRIIETARQHNVPLEEDPALASALSRVELGREIPRELWIAVAHVLAFAWTVAGKKKP